MSNAFKLGLAVMLASGSVLAQGGAPPAPPPGEVDISAAQRSNLTPQEMVAQSGEYLSQMNVQLKRIQQLQGDARRQKDIIRLNCVTDKLQQAKVNINIGEQSLGALREAIGASDEGSRTHEFTRLTIVSQKVKMLREEAEACVGEDMQYVGEGRVDTSVDPGIPHDPYDDPFTPPLPPPPPDRPPNASPFA